MVKAWGYPDETPDAVQMQVPTDMVDTVAALVQDPDAFFDAVRAAAGPEGTLLIQVDDDTWVDPTQIVALAAHRQSATASWLHLRGGTMLEVDGEPEAVLERITAKVAEAYARRAGMSDPSDSVNGNEQGEPPV